MHKIYVYGTLRPGKGPTIEVPGQLYNLGWFPGIDLTRQNQRTVCEVIEVDDEKLEALDRYEGYYPNDHEGSLYLRVPYQDGWLYVYNRSFEGNEAILSGDWFEHTGKAVLEGVGD